MEEEYNIKTYLTEPPTTKRRSLDEFLRKELERFRETAEKNPNLAQDIWVGFESELIFLIKRFFGEANYRQHVEKSVCDLVLSCLVNNPKCYETRNGDVKIYTPETFYDKRLNNINIFRIRGSSTSAREISEMSSELGFRGFNKPAQEFVADVYKIVYDAYLKETAEKDKERMDSLGSDYLL